MTAVLQHADSYLEQFRSTGESTCLATDTRREAITRFGELGFPTTRHEAWRFTNPKTIAETAFTLARGDDAAVDRSFTAAQVIDAGWPLLVFVDGRYAADLSEPGPLDGIRAGSLAAAPAEVARAVQPHVARHASFAEDAFTALNTAYVTDVAMVHVPAGTDATVPVHLLHVATTGADPLMSHPRGIIVAESGSRLTVVESFVGSGDGTCFRNNVTEIVAADNAHVDHYKVVQETPGAHHVGTTQIHQDRDSSVSSHTITLGGRLVRNDVTTVLDGEGANCTLNGLYVVNDRNHVDNHLRVEHAKPHCDSREYFKGILDGHSKAVFTGRIVVHEDAQKTDAKQTNMNLLLSEDSQVDTKPQLEIFADDVKCTHGATIGRLDEEAMFYLQSRGIDEAAARGVLLFAFAQESLDEIAPEPLRDRMQDAMYDLLPDGHLLRETT